MSKVWQRCSRNRHLVLGNVLSRIKGRRFCWMSTKTYQECNNGAFSTIRQFPLVAFPVHRSVFTVKILIISLCTCIWEKWSVSFPPSPQVFKHLGTAKQLQSGVLKLTPPSLKVLSPLSQKTAISGDTIPYTRHIRNKRCAGVLFSRLTNHRLIYLPPLPFYDSSAASHGSFERSRDSKWSDTLSGGKERFLDKSARNT